jgi:hypothetical protein
MGDCGHGESVGGLGSAASEIARIRAALAEDDDKQGPTIALSRNRTVGRNDDDHDPENHADHKPHESAKRRIGEAVVLALYFLYDGYAWWPESHSKALLLGTVGVSVILWIELPWRWWAISTAGMGIVALGLNFIVGPVRIQEAQLTFKLLPADEPTPKTGCDPSLGKQPYWSFIVVGAVGQAPTESPPKDATIVALGSNGLVLTGDKRTPIIGVGECKSLMSVQKTSDSISVDASIYDTEGKLEAQIHDNTLTTLNTSDLHISQNGDLSSLIASDGIGERLWVRFLNPHAVKIRGIFICPGSNGVTWITDEASRFFPKNAPVVAYEWGNQCGTDVPYTPPTNAAPK